MHVLLNQGLSMHILSAVHQPTSMISEEALKLLVIPDMKLVKFETQFVEINVSEASNGPRPVRRTRTLCNWQVIYAPATAQASNLRLCPHMKSHQLSR